MDLLLNLSEDSSVKLQNRDRYAMIVGTKQQNAGKGRQDFICEKGFAVIFCGAYMLFPASVSAEISRI